MGQVGSIEVVLTREFFNAMIVVLDVFLRLHTETKFTKFAEYMKHKMLRHGRRFRHKNADKVVIYFYEKEAAVLIKLLAVYAAAMETPVEDYYEKIGKEIPKHDDTPYGKL